MNIRKKNLKKIIIVISISILILLIIGLLQNKLSFFDNWVYDFIIRFKSPFLTKIFKFITFFASIYWFIIVFISLFIFNRDRRLNMIMGLYIVVIVIITFFMKNIFERERPLDLMIIEEFGYSFPSGHSSSSIAFYGFIAYLIYKSKYSNWKKIILISLLFLVTFFIGVSRIYLGVHYATDVLAGFMVGLIYLMIFILIYDIEKRDVR